MTYKEHNMSNTPNQTLATVRDVIAFLANALLEMRAYPLENDFQAGYEQAVNSVMCDVLRAAPASEICSCGNCTLQGTVLSNTPDQTLRTVRDVVDFLDNTIRNLRSYPLESEFGFGWERAYYDVMYRLSSKDELEGCTESTDDANTCEDGANVINLADARRDRASRSSEAPKATKDDTPRRRDT
jgi:hypothetical protein